MGHSKAKSELINVYIEALGLSWISIWADKAGAPVSQLQVGHGVLIDAGLPSLSLFDTLWFEKEAHANFVFDHSLSEVGVGLHSPFPHAALDMRQRVAGIARDLGATWRTTTEVVNTAIEAVDEVERHITALNASGGLKSVNSGYKKYRIAMQTTGEAAVNYSAYLQRFKVKMTQKIAKNVAEGVDKFTDLASILPGSFGIFKKGPDRFDDTPRSARVYPNRGWSNHSFRKS